MKEEPSGKAIASLVFGILSWTGMCCLGPILAIALGTGDPNSLARAGVILGWANIAFTVLAILVAGLFALVGGSFAAFH